MVILGNLILIACYGMTLIRMKKGTKFELFMTLIILLIAACIFAIMLATSDFFVVRFGAGSAPDTNIMIWVAINAVAYCGYGVTFNVAHWLFAFEYFSIAKTMPLVLKGVSLSADDVKCH